MQEGADSDLAEIHAARKRPLQSRRQTSVSSPVIEAPSTEDSAVEGVPIPQTFPPPPNPNGQYPASSSPTSAASRAASYALSRALNLASRRLGWGSPTTTSRPSPPTPVREQPSPRRLPRTVEGDEADPVEDALLSELEGRAQKTEVLTHWADELYEFVKAVPQSKRPQYLVNHVLTQPRAPPRPD
jgi:serine/threonine-protein kinase ULK2